MVQWAWAYPGGWSPEIQVEPEPRVLLAGDGESRKALKEPGASDPTPSAGPNQRHRVVSVASAVWGAGNAGWHRPIVRPKSLSGRSGMWLPNKSPPKGRWQPNSQVRRGGIRKRHSGLDKQILQMRFEALAGRVSGSPRRASLQALLKQPQP